MTEPVEKTEEAVETSAIQKVSYVPSPEGSALVALAARKHPSVSAYEAILRKLEEHPLRRNFLFITSVQPGDGTTTTATNLAGVLSRRPGFVLLIELRLTDPKLLQLLGNPGDVRGLEDGLKGKATFDDCVFQLANGQPSEVKTAGGQAIEGQTSDVKPAEGELHMLAVKKAFGESDAAQLSGSLNDLLGWAEHNYDWVVLDCPPVSASTWTRWFALNADPVLLVTRAGATPMRELEKIARDLKDRLAGVILNDS